MSLLKIYRGQALRQALKEIKQPVEVIYFALEQPEPDTLAALSELMALTGYLSVTTQAAEANAPADRLVVRSHSGRELVFVGAPLGLELAALVSAIIVSGRGDSGLLPATRQALAQLHTPLKLEIFTTPTWPHCAQAVSLAHKFAFETPHIKAEAVSAVVMTELAQHYKVMSTPHIVLNETHELKGRVSEEELLAAILRYAG